MCQKEIDFLFDKILYVIIQIKTNREIRLNCLYERNLENIDFKNFNLLNIPERNSDNTA